MNGIGKKYSRRSFLHLVGLIAAGAVASACVPFQVQLAPKPPALPAWQDDPAATFQALNRMTFGARISDRQRAEEIGLKNWIEEQLSADLPEDASFQLRMLPFTTLSKSANELADWSSKLFGEADRLSVPQELRQATLIRQVYSKRQLYEVMVEFWTDHFNISIDKGDDWFLKTVDDRSVIRANAMGRFGDLLQSSAHSPAMLVYLDNQANHKGKPNENYARELMELHTLGVHGGYTQQDVMEMARCLTGWGVKEHFWRGDFTFQPDLHDDLPKRILGMEIAPSGIQEAEKVFERLATHPNTAIFIATKLVRRLVADDPPADVVSHAADTFTRTHGDMRAVLRSILLDGGLDRAAPKFKRPVNFLTSALRLLNAQTDGGLPLQAELARMGQAPFGWPTPDGFPDMARPWEGGLMARWQLSLALARNEIKGTTIDSTALLESAAASSPGALLDQFSRLLLGKVLPDPVRANLVLSLQQSGQDLEALAQAVIAGLLASPAFQWR